MPGKGGDEKASRDTAHNLAGGPAFAERREVTALYYDLIESTALLTRSDLEEFEEIISAFHDRAASAVRAQGGSVADPLGDGAIAFFGDRDPMEDSAVAAIRAGLDIVQACRRLAGETGQTDLHVRVGIATSEVIVQGPEARSGTGVTGLAPALASRLQGIAPSDTVAVSERTRHLARGRFVFQFLGRHELKGFEERHPVWGVRRRVFGATRFLASGGLSSSRMVGRESELQAALAPWQRVLEGSGQALLVSGEAGIGKSRLVYEVLRSTRPGRPRVLVLQCSSRGNRTGLSPLVELVRSSVDASGDFNGLGFEKIAGLMRRERIVDDDVIATIAFAVGGAVPPGRIPGIDDPARLRDQINRAVRHCLEIWLEAGPVIIVVEDLQWIDPTSQDLLRDLIGWGRSRRVFFIMTTRGPSRRADLGEHVEEIGLGPLPEHKVSELVANLSPGGRTGELPPAVFSAIHERTNGVPLYVEELAQWLGSVASPDADNLLDVLSSARIRSFETVLSARLGALGAAKTVAQAASVVGREFDEQFLQQIVPDVQRERLSTIFGELVDANVFVREARGRHVTYAFRHSLFQEALYGTLLRRARTTLHEKAYLAATSGIVRIPPATIAVHAEQAGRLADAVQQFVAAAKESFTRSSVVEARQLLERALHLLDRLPGDDDHERLELSALAALGPVLTSTDGTKSPDACALYERAVRIARRRPDHEQAGWFPIYWGWWYTGADFGIQRERAAAVMSDLRAVEDPEIRLQVQHCIWAIDFNMGRHDTCIAAVDAGLMLYREGSGRQSLTLYGGHDPRACGLGQKGLSLWFKGFPKQALESVNQARIWARRITHVGSIAHAYDIAAMLHHYRGDYTALRRTARGMRRLAHKHGLPLLSSKADIFEGWCVACLGEPERGRAMAEKGLAVQEEIGTREDFPVYAEMLAQMMRETSGAEPAARLLEEAVEEAERTRHLYWLPELYRRQATLAGALGRSETETAALITAALDAAHEQNAMTLFLRAYLTAHELGLAPAIDARFHDAIGPAMASVEHGGELGNLLASISRLRDSAKATGR